jgi:hypothetical protein
LELPQPYKGRLHGLFLNFTLQLWIITEAPVSEANAEEIGEGGGRHIYSETMRCLIKYITKIDEWM